MGSIRFILALAVLVFHSHDTFLGLPFFGQGAVAVQAFFVISGFYMALVLNEKYTGATGRFYFNRFLRIYPMWWAFVALEVVVALAYTAVGGNPLGWLYSVRSVTLSATEWFWAIQSNFTALGIDAAILRDSVTGAVVASGIVSTVGWSLSAEILFYAAAPFFVRSRTRVVAVLVVGGLIRLAIAVATGFEWTVWNYYFFPSNVFFFALGAFVWFQGRSEPYQRLRAAKVEAVVGWTAVAALVVSASVFRFVPVSADFFVVALALAVPVTFAASKASSWDRKIGELSFPLYLSHHAVLSLYAPVRHFVSDGWRSEVVLAASLMLSFVALYGDSKLEARFKKSAHRDASLIGKPASTAQPDLSASSG